MKNQLIIPVAVYVFYMFGIAAYLFRTRVNAIKANHSLLKYFKAHTGCVLPERAIVIARHHDNQFEVPIVFILTCAFYVGSGLTNDTAVILAWAFVISRWLHSWIHLGSNNVRKRVVFFAMGWIIVLLMWAQLVYLSL